MKWKQAWKIQGNFVKWGYVWPIHFCIKALLHVKITTELVPRTRACFVSLVDYFKNLSYVNCQNDLYSDLYCAVSGLVNDKEESTMAQ